MPDAPIICVSVNPAMDRRLRLGSLAVGEVNRAETAHGFAGGKAAHVAMAARALAAKAVWIGFLGGPIGEECSRQMNDLGIQVVSIPTVSSTRVNLEIIEDSGRVTEILEPGVGPTAAEKENFVQKCTEAVRKHGKGTVLVISGSLPVGLKPNFYVSLIQAAREAGAKVFIDTSGDALRASSEANPDFVKTNRFEAESLLGRPLKTTEEVVRAASEIIQRGSASAAITLGREGLVWIERKNGPVWIARPPRMNLISTVGCGDATLGGFARASAQGIEGEDALRLAAACGAANCIASAPGRIELAVVQSLIPQIEVQQLP
ncbi:MAG: hexose kinase [Candidatus Acidiferrales bacterium]